MRKFYLHFFLSLLSLHGSSVFLAVSVYTRMSFNTQRRNRGETLNEKVEEAVTICMCLKIHISGYL
jgi:hypothetical protein